VVSVVSLKTSTANVALVVSMLKPTTMITQRTFLLLAPSLVVLFADIECMLCKYSPSFRTSCFSSFLLSTENEFLRKMFRFFQLLHRNNYLHFFSLLFSSVCSQKCFSASSPSPPNARSSIAIAFWLSYFSPLKAIAIAIKTLFARFHKDGEFST
jgi:hypothetical protein